MVGEQSLQDVLNVVASMATAGEIFQKHDKRTNGNRTNDTALTEFDAFMSLDPLLVDLQKQYLDAKAQRLQSACEFGADDAMTDMAIYNEDSAWCAVQTRYMELRSDRMLMRQAQTMMQESAEEERMEAQRTKEQDAMKTFLQLQMYQRMHEIENKQSNTAWWWLMFILTIQTQEQFLRQPVYAFNRLAA